MYCPHCEKELIYPLYAENNVTQYNSSCVVATFCCGKAIKLMPLRSVVIEKSDATGKDDWGTPIKE